MAVGPGCRSMASTVKPRLTQFYQGLAAGDGDHGYEYGGKADLRVTTDLGKLGLWDGFSMTIQAEYNFGNSVNGRGGALIPVNTALNSPGWRAPTRSTSRVSISSRSSATRRRSPSARST